MNKKIIEKDKEIITRQSEEIADLEKALKLKDEENQKKVEEIKKEFNKREFMEVYDEGNSFLDKIDKIFTPKSEKEVGK